MNIKILIITVIFSLVSFAKDNDKSHAPLYKTAFENLAKARTETEKNQQRMALSVLSTLDAIMPPQDIVDAKEVFAQITKAANLNISGAQYALSNLYSNGSEIFDKETSKTVKIVEKDSDKSLVWLKKSAANGYPDGQYELGFVYEKGEKGILENDKEAAKWFEKSALNGKVEGMVKFALALAQGHGVKKNNIKALSWIIVAGSENDKVEENVKKAISEMNKELKEHMSQSEIEKAQDLAIQQKSKVEKNRAAFKV